jgi:hypothetical protein
MSIVPSFDEEMVKFKIHERRVYGEPDVDRVVEVRYDSSYVLPPAPPTYKPDRELEFWVPQRREIVAFQYRWHFEGAGRGGDDYYSGPYSIGIVRESSSRVLIPSELAPEIFVSLRDVYAEICKALTRHEIQLHDLPPRKFEEFVASVFENHGYHVELTKATRDGGYDIIAIRENPIDQELRMLIECKRYAPNKPVGISVIRELWGVILDPANEFHCGMVATSSRLSLDAKNVLSTTHWRLSELDHNAIMKFAGFRKDANGLWLPR